MASPFSIFRRHQKLMLAVLTLLAMFAFVFLDPLLQAFRGDAPADPVVVSTRRYGNLHDREIRNLIHQRQLVLNVFERALIGGGVPHFFASFQVQQVFGPPDEEAVVNTWLLAQHAEQVGMVVDDSAVNEFLNSFLEEYTENQFTISDLAGMLKADKIPQRTLFAALRRELLALGLRQSFRTSLLALPPMQRWDFYLRLNRRATVELVPVPVVDFMDEIEAPGDRTLRAFFEEHKDRLWRPDRPEPAFREPERIALQYFRAEVDDFVDPDAVTREEIVQYYEEHKDTRFLQPQAPVPLEPDMPGEEPPAEPAPEDPAEPVEEPADPIEEPAEPIEEPAEPVEEPAEPIEEPAEPVEEPAEPVEEPAEPVEEPAEPVEGPEEPFEEPDEPAEEPEEPVEEPAEPVEEAVEPEGAGEASPEPSEDPEAAQFGPNGAHFRWTSFVDEVDEEHAAPADEPSPEVGDPKPPQPVAQDVPAPALPAQPDPADDEPALPEPSVVDAPSDETRFHVPLSEVENEIRAILAHRKARENVEELLQSLRARIQQYYDDRAVHEWQLEDDPTAEPPEHFDMAEIAAEHGLKSFETALLSPWEVQATDIGRSLIEASEPFVQYAFERLPVRQPAISQDEESYFLFWKTEETEQRVPSWQDANVREQVLEAWKLVEARELARARAEALAAQARDSKQTLSEHFADRPEHEVVQAGPFSWMTFGDVPPMLAQEPPRLSEVEGVDFTGRQFMRDVFALDEGELGVTMNQPQTYAYVVRMERLDPSRTVLWEGFLVDDLGRYIGAGVPDLRQMQAAWQEKVAEAAGLEWKRDPWRGRD